MIVRYFSSAPQEDILLTRDDLTLPFKTTPSETHPFLTLGAYLGAVRDFLLRNENDAWLNSRPLRGTSARENIRELLIRSEKHGVLYHLSSAEIRFKGHSTKVAVSTAVSEEAKGCLRRESQLLRELQKRVPFPCLPQPHVLGEIPVRVGEQEASLVMLASEWLDGYHEWHLSRDKATGKLGVCIWDMTDGHRFATDAESYEIYREASKILTLCYDSKTGRQIHPWHHAAGDFVVRSRAGRIGVKLTTARAYASVTDPSVAERISPFLSPVYFFLDMTLRMRLDRIDGTGPVAWGDGTSVKAVIAGFLEASRLLKEEGRDPLGRMHDLVALLRAFSAEELLQVYASLLTRYGYAREERNVSEAHMDEHVTRLAESLHAIPPEDLE